MIEAWFSASEMIASSGPSRVSNSPPVGVEAGGKEDRVFLAKIGGDRTFQFAMQRLRARR